ncbi:SpoIID/LytB domain-containing protein [Candidatus Falkowbacteria bacterium]|jgi:hypothetical protein|nr:SpoIID/LytB domain-containing protein [Candidatus Falkowbacteria bacterium]MBT6574050.1 SpoIID/LytB domain-containing protein [Candidatus Falkowbacteria bacterium]MBT7348619.1 SpoIID/LytB domain-containing protein [Candidatus Falkowbacteria bacterium]MBT7500410.1 SpoIID/LytB domain-containing protein [Candidatus Falkowbacteria bacterium]
MHCHTKYLSYSWNAQAKAKIKNNKLYKKAQDEKSWLNVFSYVFISFILVVTTASGLRLIEKNLFTPTTNPNNPLALKIVMAAELSNQANLFYQSLDTVNIKPNQAFTFNLSYKNEGTSTWTKESVYLKSMSTALKFRHNFWPDAFHPAQLQEEEVNPGETGTFKFALQAPKNINEYVGKFVLVRDNIMISGGTVEISMNVVNNPEDYSTAKNTTQEEVAQTEPETVETKLKAVCTLKLNIASVDAGLDNVTCAEQFDIEEKGPNIEVGILNTDNFIRIKNSKAWQVYDENDILLASVPADTILQFNYINAKGEYVFDFINKTVRTKTNLYLRNSNHGIFTITSLDDIPTWNKTLNYNQFTGDLHLNYYEPKDRTWLIEILPLESYLKGIKETSNSDPIEYQKAMIIAARTYALYHLNKFEVEDSFFDVYPDERDQVYKGYVIESIMPNQMKAVKETEGVVLTHNSEVIIAYYSAQSGGQTTNINNLPYLNTVKTPYSAKYGKWGHGYGIDQVDAKARAKQLNWTYDEILNYYYKNIDIEKIY